MPISLRPFLIATAFIVASCTASFAEEGFSSPQKLLSDIYSRYKIESSSVAINYSDPKIIEKYFAPHIAAKIIADNAEATAAGEVPTLDGDPFLNAQDWKITDLDITVAKSSTPNDTLGYIAFKNFGETKKIILSLERTAKGWQIADIDYQGEQKLSDLYGLKR